MKPLAHYYHSTRHLELSADALFMSLFQLGCIKYNSLADLYRVLYQGKR